MTVYSNYQGGDGGLYGGGGGACYGVTGTAGAGGGGQGIVIILEGPNRSINPFIDAGV